ncbi:M20/M25/M40 family metallo-hydrolase [Robiginitomaculum antarcticum]|uniref:M20/M25/M40 family metallo-hydrolase n=1 Tax=Robiginitomaculum antarcticum TaxID=437507 RepID=UPI0003A46650|nr:M20/M25/M40 family metallo-hydrolase [Robiginitomaculum antarcticum]
MTPALKLTLLLGAAALLACQPGGSENAKIEPSAPEQVETVQINPNVKILTDGALAGTQGYDIIESLTTEIGPRLAGTPEEARAREWGVAKMKDIGLSNVRIEPFTINGWERGVETGMIISPYPQKIYLTALGGSVATPSGGVEADVVYFPTFEDLKNAPEGGLDGKIAYISGRMEKAPDGAGYGPANQKRRSGATEAAKRGAVAVLIRSVGTDSHRFPHTGQMRYADDVKKIPIAALSAPDADQMDRMFAKDQDVRVKIELGPRAVGDRPSGNVVGEIVGSEKPDEIILIGGHLDSWDLGTGAVDDGAGIGISLGAAKVIIDSGLQPKRTIRVVMFGAEEVGLLGGFAYVEAHKGKDLANHILASESDFGAGKVYELRSGLKGGDAFIGELHSQIAALGIEKSTAQTNGGPDIGPMFDEGVPAIRLQQDGTDYFDLHHTPDDTMDKIDKDDVAQNVAAWTAMVWTASETDYDFRGMN